MKRGLIGDVLSIHKDDSGIDDEIMKGNPLSKTTDKTNFFDRKNNLHVFYLGGSSVKDLFESNGLLTNSFNLDAQKAFRRGADEKNFILDLDLEYFDFDKSDGCPTDEQGYALTDTILKSTSFRSLLDFSQVITIALEPLWFRSLECKSILKKMCLTLKEYLDIDIENNVLKAFKEDLMS